MKKIGLKIFLICGLLMFLRPLPVHAAEDTVLIQVEVPEMEPVTVELQRTDYIGTIKYKLQNQVDIDLNKMDLVYNGKILSEVVRFSSGIIPSGATVTMQPSNRWNYDEVKGVDDITFCIARPKEECLTKIYAKDYGMSPNNEDNTAAFVKALKDCTANKYLVVEQGIYHFRGMTKDIEFNNMENVIIDGNGATFIFDTKHCMKIYGGNGVEFRNLKVDWDWEKIPVGSLVQIEKKHSRNVFDIRFIGVDEVDENIPIGTFMYLDPKDLVVGSYGTYKAYTPGSVEGCLQKVEKVGSNVLRITHNGDMRHFNEGEYYLLRHFEYSGRVFGIARYAKNITFNNVSIYGFTGMGWVFADKANHFQIINSYLGLDPTKTKERRISTAADAIHILNTGGYFRIADSDLSFTGDDIINIHDDVMDILSIDESRTVLRGWVTSGFAEAGDILHFRNEQLGEFTDYEAKIRSFVTDTGYERVITLTEPLPENITTDCYAYSVSHSSSNYVISNNYIHEARARAALLNDDYGLFENNYVYRTLSGAIQVRAEVAPGRWMEGEGASHVVARNNTFEECNFGGGASLVNIGVKIDGKDSTECILSDVRIENNLFLNCIQCEGQGAIAANNVDNLILSGNVMVDSGGIVIGDIVGKTIMKDNNICAEYNFLKNEYDVWRYYTNGKFNADYTGLVYDANVGWWYVENGIINFAYNGLVEYNGAWWCVAGGRVAFEYTGLWYDENVGWWYVENGAINFAYSGFVPNEFGWWCVAEGRVAFEYTGLWNDVNVGWWYVENGMINFTYSGFVPNEFGWWCVAGGRVAFEYTGLWNDVNVGWWYVENGRIKF